jgi:diguanylate cyclase (GGDEF)-like protein/PAS domain S-box-containing protein
MIRFSPALRISMGLVFITVSIVLFGNFIGLIPDETIMAIEARKKAAELLAAQCTVAARNNNLAAIRNTMDMTVELQPEVLSLGMRNVSGRYLAQTKAHKVHWVAPSGEESTSTHWQVPIYQDSRPWGTLEISFTPGDAYLVLGYRVSPFAVLLGFFMVMSLGGFWVFMKRNLRHLDPSTVMPGRVKYALDSLSEGVILMDTNERIILANSALADKLGCSVEALMGLKASKLEWIAPGTGQPEEMFPWTRAMSQGEEQSGISLHLGTQSNGIRHFTVHVAPILDDKGKSRGALTTFNDITELENKNTELIEIIELLQKSNYKVELQNKELEVLATTDSLTGCLNRRAFFAEAKQYLPTDSEDGIKLACIMVDIDYFKSVNDKYGHSAGDQVIKYFADVLKSSVREKDTVCRYGGEEFCILLPDADMHNASDIAENVRRKIVAQGAQAITEAPGIRVSASFGVSQSSPGEQSLEELFVKADRALYKAKEGGRNRVVSWDSALEAEYSNNLASAQNSSYFHS